MTSHPARFLGLAGRGQLETGMAADLNVIDPDAVGLGPVSFVTDLPAQARRLFQPGRGYRATLVAGRVVVADGEPTHARPGRLLGGGAVPAAGRGR